MKIVIDQPKGFLDIGKRVVQQDAVYPAIQDFRDDNYLFIICDGMGGHADGEIASSTVIESIVQNYDSFKNHNQPVEAFNLLLEKAWKELDEHYDVDLGERQMGTTLAFLSFTDKGYLAAHIGDSRIYHIRPANVTQFIYKSSDHSQVAGLINDGILTQLEALTYKAKNILNKAMIPQQRYQAEIFEGNDVKKGDYFMLCSDGVLECLTDEMIEFIFAPYRSTDEIFNLIHHHCINLSNDNNSCIIMHVTGVGNEDVINPSFTNNHSSIKQWKDDNLLRETITQYSKQ